MVERLLFENGRGHLDAVVPDDIESNVYMDLVIGFRVID